MVLDDYVLTFLNLTFQICFGCGQKDSRFKNVFLWYCRLGPFQDAFERLSPVLPTCQLHSTLSRLPPTFNRMGGIWRSNSNAPQKAYRTRCATPSWPSWTPGYHSPTGGYNIYHNGARNDRVQGSGTVYVCNQRPGPTDLRGHFQHNCEAHGGHHGGSTLHCKYHKYRHFVKCQTEIRTSGNILGRP